jgi:hypothetical protein
MNTVSVKNPAFIVGSPRSGTTFLGDVLDLHDDLAFWYEPYFVFDRYFQTADNDCRTAHDASPQVRAHIYSELAKFSRHNAGRLVVDKSPRNSLKIPFLNALFPGAKYIHLVRDGRDAILSIHREWQKRRTIIQDRKLFGALSTLIRHVNRQPLLRHKAQVLRFEFGQLLQGMRGLSFITHTTRRWHGRIGWGPQFQGWQDVIDDVPLLQFNALQWKHCVEAIHAAQLELPANTLLEVRYEEFIQHPLVTLERIFTFLEVDVPPDMEKRLPPIMGSNFNKWEKGYSVEDKHLIGSTIAPLLIELGYAEDTSWYA